MSIFGLDLGFGANDLVGEFGSFEVPSHVAIGNGRSINRMVGMQMADRAMVVEVDGQAMFVGENSHSWGHPIENLDYGKLEGTPEMKAIVYAVFTKYMCSCGDIPHGSVLYVGMPMEPLSKSDTVVRRTVNRVKKWLTGDHYWVADGVEYQMNIGKVAILTQAQAAYFDFMLDFDGSFIPERKQFARKEVGIVSVGYNTLELLAFAGTTLQADLTRGIQDKGVTRLAQLLDPENLYKPAQIDGRIRTGQYRSADIETWASEVSGAIRKHWGKYQNRFDKIVLVGGGSVLLGNRLAAHFNGRGQLAEDPVMSVANGLYKRAVAREARA